MLLCSQGLPEEHLGALLENPGRQQHLWWPLPDSPIDDFEGSWQLLLLASRLQGDSPPHDATDLALIDCLAGGNVAEHLPVVPLALVANCNHGLYEATPKADYKAT
eukprot:15474603-Alexandrium_andersonii.AAC.1